MSYNFTQSNEELAAVTEWLRKDYLQISTGRANPALLDGVNIDSYGSQQPVKNVAAITIEEARTLRIVPWDKSQIKDIEKAIIDSGLGLSTAAGDSGVRVIFPRLTEETRAKLAKALKAKLEEARISIRKERQEAIDGLEKQKKDGEITEDDLKRGKDDIQKLVDDSNKKLEEIYKAKEEEVMKV